jgi:hypothetical protein
MYHIYMPVEMVLLMTKNRHFINKELAVNTNASVSKNKICKYENECDDNQTSNIIELYKCL